MRLGIRLLNDVQNVNAFTYICQVECQELDTIDVYIQLTDSSVEATLSPPGRRYMPVDGSTLSVYLKDIDDTNNVTVEATQPFAQDPSIWKFSLRGQEIPAEVGPPAIEAIPSETLPGTRGLKVTLTEPAPTEGDSEAVKITYAWKEQAIVVHPSSPEF
jgi:hypothetical protein